ncbi:hypothetical protein ABT340_28625 [Streptosporangium sp. NPDC000239]|uniref:hypothetical protein n=1 Tax=Streptosporangium sp. NPDC000239 TaxID=3154248 RepID=UPI003332B6AF
MATDVLLALIAEAVARTLQKSRTVDDPHFCEENEPTVAAVERWRRDRSGALAADGIALTVKGPFDALGMDPVYVLQLERASIECVIAVFRGGILDVTRVDWDDQSIEHEGVQVTSAAELAEALDRIVWKQRRGGSEGHGFRRSHPGV